MAFEEDVNKRRAQREALKQQRLKEHKALMVKLIIAGVILGLCTLAIAGFAVKYFIENPPELPPVIEDTIPTEPTTQPTEPEVPGTTQPEYTVIHLTAAGDVNVTDATVNQDHKQVFRDILPLLAQGDLTLVNFEGNLVGAPYGTQSASAPISLVTALKSAGVDLVQMANTYSIYNAVGGLGTTLSALRQEGLEPLGAWATAQEAKEAGGFTIREVEGVKIAFVAFTKGMGSMALPTGSEGCVNVLYTDYATTYQRVDTEGITAVMERVAKAKPDITIALVHWGSEYRDQLSSTQREIKNLLHDLGADAILGTHSHYVQGMELDEETGKFVAWSLGDLLSDGLVAGTNYSVVLDLEITKDNITGDAKITDFSYTPFFNAREGDSIRLLRLEEAIAAYEDGFMFRVSDELYGDMVYARTRVEERINGN